jgi:hypothetical protein
MNKIFKVNELLNKAEAILGEEVHDAEDAISDLIDLIEEERSGIAWLETYLFRDNYTLSGKFGYLHLKNENGETVLEASSVSELANKLNDTIIV